jgi:hypothetical protein
VVGLYDAHERDEKFIKISGKKSIGRHHLGGLLADEFRDNVKTAVNITCSVKGG